MGNSQNHRRKRTAEIRRLLGYQGIRLPEDDLAGEKFEIIVPVAYSSASNWGVSF